MAPPKTYGQQPAFQKSLLFLFIVFCVKNGTAQDVDAWDRVLNSHVRVGTRLGLTIHTVDYATLVVDPDFTYFVKTLDAVDPFLLDRDAFFALFMNAYNALAMKLVGDHACKYDNIGRCLGPISSIGDIGKTGSPKAPVVWTMPAGSVGGQVYSLKQLEDILRSPPHFTPDPRLHACIVCASVSCPDLPMQAFRKESLNTQMDAQMRSFLANPQKGFSLDRIGRVIQVSMIFKWSAEDFEQSAGNVVDFILPFIASASDRAFIFTNRQSLALTYFPWHRESNGEPPCTCPRSLNSGGLTNIGYAPQVSESLQQVHVV